MNILIISAPSPLRVAGTVASNILNGLRDKGHRVRLIIRDHGLYGDPDVVNLQTKAGLFMEKARGRLARGLDRLTSRGPRFDPDYCVQDPDETKEFYTSGDILRRAGIKPDVILYIFPGSLLNARNLYELNQRTGAPIFWYLMDSAALTGGCHYAWDCLGYTTGCGQCPAIRARQADDQSAVNLRFKQTHFAKTDISIISATEWQHRMALRSLLFGSRALHKVLLPVNPDVFHPADMAQARKMLGISSDRQVIFCGAAQLDEKRKGMKYLAEALQILKQSGAPQLGDVLLLVAGSRFDTIAADFPVECKPLGLLADDQALAQAFQAADFFVCPSVEDAGPMMINQALMCGKPVVAFDMGVASDLVLSGKTGHVAALKDSRDLAAGIADMLALDGPARLRYADRCRQLALEKCTPGVQMAQLEQIFADAVAARSAA